MTVKIRNRSMCPASHWTVDQSRWGNPSGLHRIEKKIDSYLPILTDNMALTEIFLEENITSG